MIRALTAAAAVATAALVTAAVGLGGSTAAATTVRATVGPGFTIDLTKGGAHVKTLRAGTYRFIVADRSAEHNFVLARGTTVKQLTSVAFVGTKTVTLKLAKGAWTYFCAPHASAMNGRFRVGTVTTLAAKSQPSAPTRVDDNGGGREAEPGDDHGGGGEPEPGDDRGRGGHD